MRTLFLDNLPRAQASRLPSRNGRYPTTLGELHLRYPRRLADSPTIGIESIAAGPSVPAPNTHVY